ncbi:hypothetical protein AB1Y20_018884 [Prymnesium parvum]|uniref:glycine--tRNA ligase n=1 Tax=Prymnesium parvum TaxID=97485 RepID=A0AB34JPR1_PRYPA
MPITASQSSAAFAAARENLDDLIKRRFFFRQAFEIYGGVGGFYTYGPPGAAVKQNLISLWRNHFVIEENLLEVDDTCIMPHDVLFTSGHVERFNDFIVKDAKDPKIFFRADKLLEDVMEQRLNEKGVSDEMKQELTKVKNQADAYSKDELWAVFQKYQIKSPDTKNDLTEPQEFNLMFPTPIGPLGGKGGYLRPETAQGIFLNFKFCLEQNANNMPFGVAQVGKAFRNEIAPRAGLIRQREFTQAEIEYFVKPGDKPHPKFVQVASLELLLFSSKQQLDAAEPQPCTLGAAVSSGMIANETLGYYIGRTYLFLLRAGCRGEHVRFRQHLPDEMAHYACDCWDAEIEMSLGWVECVGIADRSAYDLTVHSKATNTPLVASTPLETPRVVDVYTLTKKSLATIGKVFKADAKAVTTYLTELDADGLKALEAEAQASGKASITVDGKTFEVPAESLVCEAKTEKQNVETFTPNVIEPSFGIDRILAAIYEHSFFVRADEKEEADKEKADDKKAKKGDKKVVNGVLSLPAEIAPYKVAILPLDMRVVAQYGELLASLRTEFSQRGLQYKVDDSGASIGKKYARADELGIPYALTIDFDTIGLGKQNEPLLGTVTLRDRDSTQQVRVPLDDAPDLLYKLCTAAPLCWADMVAVYGPGATGPSSDSEGSSAMLRYLSEHGITSKLNEAVNALAKARPADPIAFLVEQLQK